MAKKLQKKILYYIIENPGVYVSEIMNQLEIPFYIVSYNTRKIEKDGAIFSKYDGLKNRLYPIYMKNEKLPIMLTPKNEEIFKIVKRYPGSIINDLVKRCGKTHYAIYHHIKRLRVFGLIRTKIVKGKHHFYAKGDHLLFHGHKQLDGKELRERYLEIKKTLFRLNGYRVREKNQWEIAYQNRRRLLSYITDNPGMPFREIGHRLKFSKRQMRNAIQVLGDEKKIFSEYVGTCKIFFPIAMKEKWRPMSLTPQMRETADIIKENPGISILDIAKNRGPGQR